MKIKDRLFTPGPTNIPQRIFAAMNNPSVHHRTKRFESIFRESLDGIRWLLDTQIDPIFLAGSGTAGMEAALLNLCTEKDTVAFLNAGKFGERWGDIAKKLGLKNVELKRPWGQSASEAELDSFLAQHPDLNVFCLQYCETSTTVLHPVAKLAKQIKAKIPNCLVIADAVSALGTTPIFPDQDSVDVLIAASHKGLMLPPGLAILSLNEQAWGKAEKISAKTLYFNLLEERKAHAKNTTAWTPAINIILGLAESIKMLKEEGLQNVFSRHELFARATREAFLALELELLTQEYPSPCVTGCFIPEAIGADKVRSFCTDKLKLQLADGQDAWKGKVIRFGHMGDIDALDLCAGISALEICFAQLGFAKNSGKAISAALNVLKNCYEK